MRKIILIHPFRKPISGKYEQEELNTIELNWYKT